MLVAKTYEMHMFKTASKKLGLDQAVLANTRPPGKGTDRAGPSKAEVRMRLDDTTTVVFLIPRKFVEVVSKKRWTNRAFLLFSVLFFLLVSLFCFCFCLRFCFCPFGDAVFL